MENSILSIIQASNADREIYSIIQRKNNGRVGVGVGQVGGGVPSFSKKQKRTKRRPSCTSGVLIVYHSFNEAKTSPVQLCMCACGQTFLSLSLYLSLSYPSPALSLSTLLMYVCNLLQPIVCFLSAVSVHIFLIHLCATIHTSPSFLSCIPIFFFCPTIFAKFFGKTIYRVFSLNLQSCRQYLFLFIFHTNNSV